MHGTAAAGVIPSDWRQLGNIRGFAGGGRGPCLLLTLLPGLGPRRVKKWITVGMLSVTAARWEGTEQDACTSHYILNLPPWFYIRWGNNDGNDAPMWIYVMNGRCCVLVLVINTVDVHHSYDEQENSIKEHASTPNVYSHYYDITGLLLVIMSTCWASF